MRDMLLAARQGRPSPTTPELRGDGYRPLSISRLLWSLLKWLGQFLLVAFFAILPTVSILVLYVIPTPYARLGAIVGEATLLICALSISKLIETKDIFAYMLG
jgi:hypothetical protein